jgi:hypothetical protein
MRYFSWSDDNRDLDYEDEYYEQKFKQQRHNKLMRLPPGHPDEEMYEEYEEEDDSY